MGNLNSLVHQLVLLPSEYEWLEFKVNNTDPLMIGEDISALANGAAFCDHPKAYLVWGVDDKTHEVVGTSFKPEQAKKGNQDLEMWLRTQLSENADFSIDSDEYEGKPIVVMTVCRAIERTVMFQRTEFIRVGSNTKKLNDVPNMKAVLWDHLRSQRFEDLYSAQDLSINEVLDSLDYPTYFELQHKPIPNGVESIIHYLKEDCLIDRQDDGNYAITNLGAILLAKRLQQFPTVFRKAARVVQYRNDSRTEIVREMTEDRGFAVCYESLIQLIEALIPAHEEMIDGRRKTVFAFPDIAIREMVANALIHQDLSMHGTGPLIEVFSNRIEITNPGIPLIEISRIIDNPPRSRNEKLAALMRRFHICEESGSGWDKTIESCESERLPAPKIKLYTDSVKVTLYSYIPFLDLRPEDRLWACYMHACIQYVNDKEMTNATLRDRFGLDDNSKSQMSRLIRQATDQHLIKPFDENTAPRYMRYIPVWA